MLSATTNISTEAEVKEYEKNTNTYSPEQLQQLCVKIEALPKINQVEILRIFHSKNKNLVNENKYGIHINITDVGNSILEEIENYLTYVSKQETDLNIIEEQQHMNEKYNIEKDNKDNEIVIVVDEL
jgi:hypothetical protein